MYSRFFDENADLDKGEWLPTADATRIERRNAIAELNTLDSYRFPESFSVFFLRFFLVLFCILSGVYVPSACEACRFLIANF